MVDSLGVCALINMLLRIGRQNPDQFHELGILQLCLKRISENMDDMQAWHSSKKP